MNGTNKISDVGDELDVPDISDTADFQAVVNILRDAYPEMDAEEIVRRVLEVMRDKNAI